jgi:hypothetical protein
LELSFFEPLLFELPLLELLALELPLLLLPELLFSLVFLRAFTIGMAAAATTPATIAAPAAIAVLGLSRATSAILPARSDMVVFSPAWFFSWPDCPLLLSDWDFAWGMAELGMFDIFYSY